MNDVIHSAKSAKDRSHQNIRAKEHHTIKAELVIIGSQRWGDMREADMKCKAAF
jgi:hypothetical protein